MYNEDIYLNYKKENSNMIKNDNGLKERQYFGYNNYEDVGNNKIKNNISREIPREEKMKKDSIPIKRVFNLLEMSNKDQRGLNVPQLKNSCNSNKNNDRNSQSSNRNISNFGNNLTGQNSPFNNLENINKINHSHNINEKKIRNSSVDYNLNANLIKITNFSVINNHEKNQIIKSSMLKNSNTINNSNLKDLTPLKGSLTIEKLNTPPKNKKINKIDRTKDDTTDRNSELDYSNSYNLKNVRELVNFNERNGINSVNNVNMSQRIDNKLSITQKNTSPQKYRNVGDDNDVCKNDSYKNRSVSNKEILNIKENVQGNLVKPFSFDNEDSFQKTDNDKDNNKMNPVKKPILNLKSFYNKNIKKKFSFENYNKKTNFLEINNVANKANSNIKVSEKNIIEPNKKNSDDVIRKIQNENTNSQAIEKNKIKPNRKISQPKIKTKLSLNDENMEKNPNKIIKKTSGKSKTGRYLDGKDKTNQDSYLIKDKIFGNENFSIIGVFDGHGAQGHYISNLLKLFFSEYFTKVDLYKPDNKQIINSINSSMKNCFSDLNNLSSFQNNYDRSNTYNYSNFNNFSNFLNSSAQYNPTSSYGMVNTPLGINLMKKNSGKIQNDVLNVNSIFYEKLIEDNFSIIKNSYNLAETAFSQSKYDMNFSGSTCVCLFIVENKIICANCGDSRAILVSSEKNQIIPLSLDHKPDIKEEAYRIIKNNGRVEKRSDNGIKTGPLRVWLKNENYPGLAMTRSIGDMVASKIGVTCEPEIIEYTLNGESKFVVIASDGIWEIFTNEEVASIVNPYYTNMDVESATEKLVDEAAKRWRKIEKAQDDITAVVIFFQKNH